MSDSGLCGRLQLITGYNHIVRCVLWGTTTCLEQDHAPAGRARSSCREISCWATQERPSATHWMPVTVNVSAQLVDLQAFFGRSPCQAAPSCYRRHLRSPTRNQWRAATSVSALCLPYLRRHGCPGVCRCGARRFLRQASRLLCVWPACGGGAARRRSSCSYVWWRGTLCEDGSL